MLGNHISRDDFPYYRAGSLWVLESSKAPVLRLILSVSA
jgi:hypothetical protein